MLKFLFVENFVPCEHWFAGVAQLVELLPSKQTVARSSRVARSIFKLYSVTCCPKQLKAYPKAPFAIVLNDKVDEEIFHKDRKIYFISFKNIDYLEELLNS